MKFHFAVIAIKRQMMTDHLPAGLERLIAKARSAAVELHVRSAVNPMLWASAIIGLPCLILSYFFRDDVFLANVLVILGTSTIGVTIIAFLYFMVFNPEKLQSEDYQLKHEALEIIKEKGSSLELLPSSLDSISNPIIRPISGGQ